METATPSACLAEGAEIASKYRLGTCLAAAGRQAVYETIYRGADAAIKVITCDTPQEASALAPRFVLAALLGALLRRVGPEPGAVSLVDLIPTLHYDAVIVAAGEGRLGAFADIEATVLLLGGSRSPKYIKSALAALEETLPNASRVELRGCGHSAPDNDAQPTHVAEELIRFFS